LITIKLEGVGKRFKAEWILKKLDVTFQKGQHYAITGPNGSGKSTLLKILSGHLSPTRGNVSFFHNDQAIETSQIYTYLAFAAPYIDLIEEFTLLEALHFHQRFQPFLNGLQPDDLVEILNFKKSRNKEVRFFSSGMKQRLKLVLALCSATSLLLLDEPTTNLDQQGMEWYRHLIDQYVGDRTLIIASNVAIDFDFCPNKVNILDYK
jgi:ABC-2 type transport system ATP-binding protein